MKQLKKFVNKYVPITKKIIAVSALMCVLGWGMYFGANYFPRKVAAQVTVAVESTSTPPILVRIAKCESSGSQTLKGQVLVHINDNKTVDIGKYAINLQTWGVIASRMGYDLTNEADNEAFAKYLYATKGTEPWYSSKACWSR